MSCKKVVTPQQLKAGYKRYHQERVPNVTWHEFKVLERMPDGNYVVEYPDLDSSGGAEKHGRTLS